MDSDVRVDLSDSDTDTQTDTDDEMLQEDVVDKDKVPDDPVSVVTWVSGVGSGVFFAEFVPDILADIADVLKTKIHISSDKDLLSAGVLTQATVIRSENSESLAALAMRQFAGAVGARIPENGGLVRELFGEDEDDGMTLLAVTPEFVKHRELTGARLKLLLARAVNRRSAYRFGLPPDAFRATALSIPDDTWLFQAVSTVFRGLAVLCLLPENGKYESYHFRSASCPDDADPSFPGYESDEQPAVLLVYMVRRRPDGSALAFYRVGHAEYAENADPFIFTSFDQPAVTLLVQHGLVLCPEPPLAAALSVSDTSPSAIPSTGIFLSDRPSASISVSVPTVSSPPVDSGISEWTAANDTLTPLGDLTATWQHYYLPTHAAIERLSQIDFGQDLLGGPGPVQPQLPPRPRPVASVEEILLAALSPAGRFHHSRSHFLHLSLRKRFWQSMTRDDFNAICLQTATSSLFLRELLQPSEPWPWPDFVATASAQAPLPSLFKNRRRRRSAFKKKKQEEEAELDESVLFPKIPPVTAALVVLARAVSLDLVVVDSDTGEVRTYFVETASQGRNASGSIGKLVVVDLNNSGRWAARSAANQNRPLFVCAWPLRCVENYPSPKEPSHVWYKQASRSLDLVAAAREGPSLCELQLGTAVEADFGPGEERAHKAATACKQAAAAKIGGLYPLLDTASNVEALNVAKFARITGVNKTPEFLDRVQQFIDGCTTCSLASAAALDMQETGQCPRVDAQEVNLWRTIALASSRAQMDELAKKNLYDKPFLLPANIPLKLGYGTYRCWDSKRTVVYATSVEMLWILDAIRRRQRVISRYDSAGWISEQLQLGIGAFEPHIQEPFERLFPVIVELALFARNIWPVFPEQQKQKQRNLSLDGALEQIRLLCEPRLCALRDYRLRWAIAVEQQDDTISSTTPGEDERVPDVSAFASLSLQVDAANRSAPVSLLYKIASRSLPSHQAADIDSSSFDESRAHRDLAGRLAFEFQDIPEGATHLTESQIVTCARNSGYFGISLQDAWAVRQGLAMAAAGFWSDAWDAHRTVGPKELNQRVCAYCQEYERHTQGEACCPECLASSGLVHSHGLSFSPVFGGHTPRLCCDFVPSNALLDLLQQQLTAGETSFVVKLVQFLSSTAMERAALLRTGNAELRVICTDDDGVCKNFGRDLELAREALRVL